MQERHRQRLRYFKEQAYTTEKHVIPFIEDVMEIGPETEVLEIGCGEGGNLLPFLDKGCKVTGIDILESKINNAKKFFSDHPAKDRLQLVREDIYNTRKLFEKGFDLIIMRDVLEHIYDHDKFMHFVKYLLKPQGKFFLGFPPWQNPFGGHQQMCNSRVLSKFPFIHLLPGPLYPALLKRAGEPEKRISELMDIRDTRVTLGRFKSIVKKENYKIEKNTYWLINPNYEIKFGLRPRKQIPLIYNFPWIRNFMITTCYFLLSKPDDIAAGKKKS